MIAIKKNLGLDDGDKPGVLANCSIARETICTVSHGSSGRAIRDRDHRAPFAESSSLFVVLSGTVSKPIKTLTPRFVGICKWFEALVYFDARVNSIRIQGINKRRAIRARLVESLLEKDCAADVLTKGRGGDQKLTVATTVFLVVFNAHSFEARATGRIGLVHCEDALTRLCHLSGSLEKLVIIFACLCHKRRTFHICLFWAVHTIDAVQESFSGRREERGHVGDKLVLFPDNVRTSSPSK
mmetsp:Transcript_13888/g.56276  ORF Transcript_13888/g.56276 Transcript_13888/m.56276 type:complete len:241 (+) Transcript_13888:7650-8372(+)